MIHPCALCGGTSLVPYFPCFPSFFMRMSFHLRMDDALFSWWIFILLNSVQGQVEGMGEMGCGILLQGSTLSTLLAVAPLFYFHSFFSLWFSCDLLGHTRDMELALPKGTFPHLSRYCWLHNVWLIWFSSYSSNDFLTSSAVQYLTYLTILTCKGCKHKTVKWKETVHKHAWKAGWPHRRDSCTLALRRKKKSCVENTEFESDLKQ